MKTIKQILILLLLSLSSIYISCVKEKSLATNGFAKIVFNISGIDNNNTKEASSPFKKKNISKSTNYQTLNEFDVLTLINDDNDDKSNIYSKQAATRPIEENITYRILIYKKINNEYVFVDNISLTKNDPNNTTEIGITRGIEYHWYAYSYNETDKLPTLTATEIENGTVYMGINKDFIYDTGNFKLQESGTHVINIIFKRKTAQIELDFDGRGIFTDEIQDISISIPNGMLKTANFDLINNAVSTTKQNISNLEIPYSSFKNTESNYTDRKVTQLHTVSVESLNNPSITLKKLKIKLDDNSSREYSQSTISFNTQTNIELGKKSIANIYFIESALTYSSVEWSRANLYRKNVARNPYRFYHKNKQTNDPNSYFSFRGHIPRKFAPQAESLQKDPCALIFPAYRWKQPIQENIYTKLTDRRGLLSNTLEGLLDIVTADPTPGAYTDDETYIEYTPSGGTTPSYYGDESNKLRFYFNGLHASVAALSDLQGGLVVLNLGNYGRASTFWTTSDNDLLGLLQLGAWGYLGARKTAIVGGRYAQASSTANVLNIGLLDLINVIRSPLLNVRCVRNPNWETLIQNENYNPVVNYD